MTLTAEQAQEIVHTGDYLAMRELSRHRWYTRRLVVRQVGDGLEGFIYLDPATEEQEGQDRFEADPVPTFPVRSRQITVMAYERID